MYENDCCYRKNKCCVDIVICILTTLIGFAVGLLIGALTGLVALLGIGAIIAVLAILIVLTIIRIITLVCAKKKCDSYC